jgi:hypothetical protein
MAAEELPDLPEESEPAAASASRPASGAPKPKREMEQAPLELRKAGLVLFVSALLPWLALGGFDLNVIWGKLTVLVGAAFLYYGVLARHGDPAPGLFRSLSASNAKLPGWIGMGLMAVGLVSTVVLVGVNKGGLSAAVEVAAVAVGATLWVQILDYEKGERFNPVMGLILPLLALAAAGRLAFIAREFDVLALLGSLGVLAAGVMAGKTMVKAMKEAKAHGEAKKRAAMEQRKLERAAKKPAAR